MNALFVIPARGGSKGIPGKNIKPLHNKPLIHYSIGYARLFTGDENICLSSDSGEIIDCAASIGLKAPFVRPASLASDTAGTYEVLQHAIRFYSDQGKQYDALVLLQPTSPLRRKEYLQDAWQLFDKQVDMVVSVHESSYNPYFNLFEENSEGWLKQSKGDGKFTRRQDAPPVYAYNGSLYIINALTLQQKRSFKEFSTIKKFVMPESDSIDLDTPADWEYAEYVMKNRNYE